MKQTSLVMGKHSGRHAFVHKLEELGYQLAGNQLEDAFVRFKALADKKKQIYDEDIEALVDEEIATAHDRIKVLSLTVIAGTMGPQTATLTLDIEGEHVTTQSTGNGPVDAIFKAIRALVPHEAALELYQVHAVTDGTDAQAEVSVRLVGEWAFVHRQGRRSRHAGCFGEGLSRRAQQAHLEAQQDVCGRAADSFHRRGIGRPLARPGCSAFGTRKPPIMGPKCQPDQKTTENRALDVRIKVKTTFASDFAHKPGKSFHPEHINHILSAFRTL